MTDSIDLSDIDINIGGSGGTDTITLDAAGYPNYYTSSNSSGLTVGGIQSFGSITVPNTITTTGTTGNGYTLGYGAGTGTSWVSPATQGSLKVTGDADFDGDVKIKGHSITNLLEKIEERLGILNPNPELEERWDRLKELRKQYIEMERDLLEKEKIMKILKES
jgi:hypothetical protein